MNHPNRNITAWMLAVLCGIALVLAGCGDPYGGYDRPAGPEETLACKVNVDLYFWNTTNGTVLHSGSYEFLAKGTPLANARGTFIPSRGKQYLPDTWQTWHSEQYDKDMQEVFSDLMIRTERANTWLTGLLRTSNYIPHLSYLPGGISYLPLGECNSHEEVPAQIGNIIQTGGTSLQGYVLTMSIEESTTFYTVSSPNGSQVTLLFPTQELSKLLDSFAIAEGPGPLGETVFTEPDVNAGVENYEQAVVADILSIESQGERVASFKFVADDVEGTHLLKQVLAKGILAVARIQGRTEVSAALTGYLGTDTKAVTAISVNEGTMSVHSRRVFLGTSSMDVASQGGSYNFDQTISVNDVIRGDVYFQNP